MWPLNGFIDLSRFCVDEKLGIYVLLSCYIYRLVFPLFHNDNIDISGPAKPGTTRKMLGSPRQLENAVPTSKNPHGVWVWRQKTAAQWWGRVHSPHVLRESWRAPGDGAGDIFDFEKLVLLLPKWKWSIHPGPRTNLNIFELSHIKEKLYLKISESRPNRCIYDIR